ncbi:exodeoxyribonuclease VII large subunit [Deinococcus sonorensis]|uniref:Exodeoxyribonuclease 7 large subunit n=2 Tax=Deinococcus sonorensis TaxID=309891 RepID=A0AAU7UCX9_9DEIO
MTRPPAQFLELADLLFYVSQVLERGIPGAVWVRCELSSVTDRRHLYLDVTQQGEDGQEVAKARATLWARERFSLEGKFRRATGSRLTAGMKVLLYVTAEFHPQYGFSLHILDIAPEYTVGDASLKLDQIRRTLEQEGLLERNRRRPAPTDYTRVAVVAPLRAAGLGDFQREADRLMQAGVVHFSYVFATFQGREAPRSLLTALSEVQLLHAADPFDAVCIIRGGGASADLAWLNDLELARAVARLPLPVITGIGHRQDDTILDELACIRTDTPSKAAALILSTVMAGAAQAEADLRTIQAAGRATMQAADSAATARFSRLHQAARQRLDTQAAALDATMSAVLGLSPRRTLERGYALVRNGRGEVITRAAQLPRGERLLLEFADGRVAAQQTDPPA